MTALSHWAMHFVLYWLVPIPLFLVIEGGLRKLLWIGKPSQPINTVLHYRISHFIDKLRKFPVFGKAFFAFAYLSHQQLLYNYVVKEGKRQWMKTHANVHHRNVTPLLGKQKKRVPNVALKSQITTNK